MMNDYWHIPRASLTSSAASSSAASLASSSNRSNRSTNLHPTTVHTMAKNFAYEHQLERNNTRFDPTLNSSGRSPTLINVNRTTTHDERLSKQKIAVENGGKRGSSSSQGSNKSNSSTRSAASGSLLLTAANLERFVEIHKKQEKAVQKKIQKKHNQYYLSGEQRTTIGATIPGTNYNSNLVHAVIQNGHHFVHDQSTQDDNTRRSEDVNNHNDAVITMDPNLDFIKAKNLDNISIASSMHFTMVNGEGGQTKKVKRGLCDRGRQVTVLIISMSTIFLLLIMGMVYALEMRAREMPKS